jgi:hypothetical protein
VPQADHLRVGRARLLEVGAQRGAGRRGRGIGEQARQVETRDPGDGGGDPRSATSGPCSSAARAASDARRLEVAAQSVDQAIGAPVCPATSTSASWKAAGESSWSCTWTPNTRRQRSCVPYRARSQRSFGSLDQAQTHWGSVYSTTSMTLTIPNVFHANCLCQSGPVHVAAIRDS